MTAKGCANGWPPRRRAPCWMITPAGAARWRRQPGGCGCWGWLSIVLIGATMAAMITLAANASLAANAQVIRVLRLVGARDSYIARAFVRRFTLRALAGAGGWRASRDDRRGFPARIRYRRRLSDRSWPFRAWAG